MRKLPAMVMAVCFSCAVAAPAREEVTTRPKVRFGIQTSQQEAAPESFSIDRETRFER